MKHCKLHVLGFAVALGLVWGLGLFCSGILAGLDGYGLDFVKAMSSVYYGYTTGFAGALIGFVWGFCDLFIFGLVVAFIYNLFIRNKSE